MATANTAARNSRAQDFADDYATAIITIQQGSTVLASHTLTGFGSPVSGTITANAIADATIASNGTADSARLSGPAGTYTLTIGTAGSGADVITSNLNYVQGETSQINTLAVNFPA